MSAGMIIIGTGVAGVRAADTLREHGYNGPVTLIGEENVLPYERPPLSKGFLTGEQPHPVPIVGEDALLADKGVTVRIGQSVREIERADQRVLTSLGDFLEYERLLIATGAHARTLSLPGVPSEHLWTLRTLEDARKIQDRIKPGLQVVVIGGGFIGLEIAGSVRSQEAEVTVLEALPQVLQRAVPGVIAQQIVAEHRARGVDIRLSAQIVKAKQQGERTVLTLKDGSELPADMIVVGIGAAPNIELAEAAGLVLDNGIAVDARLRTSDPAIFAAGDCCSFPLGLYGDARIRLESWRCAQEHGETAALNMLGKEKVYDQAPWFWSDQYDLGLQIVGLPGYATRTLERELGERAQLLFHLAEDGRLLAASGIAPGNGIARDIMIAERLINRRAQPDPEALADPGFKLKALLKS